MTEQELLQEALEWREHISKLASDYSDQELFRKRLATIEWLIKRVEELEEGVKEAVSDIENISPHEAKKTLIDLIKNMEREA